MEDRSPINVDMNLLSLPSLPHSSLELDFSNERKQYGILVSSRTPAGVFKLLTRREHNPAIRTLLELIQSSKDSIFITVPNFNTRSVMYSLLDALSRGVRVSLTTTLGMNDKSEQISGGTNLKAYKRFHKEAMSRGTGDLLRLCWYVHLKESTPTAKWVSHVKFMAFDRKIAFFGSTNLDDQSIYYSQENNLIIDNPTVTSAIQDGLVRAQKHQVSCYPEVRGFIQ